MNKKVPLPLKFTNDLPEDPVKLWNIINRTITEVDPKLGLSVEDAKIKAFITLVDNRKNYSVLKLLLKSSIDNVNIVAPCSYEILHYNITDITPELLKINLPPKLMQKIVAIGKQSIIDYAIPEKYHKLLFKTRDIVINSLTLLDDLNIVIDKDLPSFCISSKQDLAIFILKNIAKKENNKNEIILPPLYRRL